MNESINEAIKAEFLIILLKKNLHFTRKNKRKEINIFPFPITAKSNHYRETLTLCKAEQQPINKQRHLPDVFTERFIETELVQNDLSEKKTHFAKCVSLSLSEK